MPTAKNKIYRDKITGVVGVAVDHVANKEPLKDGSEKVTQMTQLRLRPEHLTGDVMAGFAQGHDMRWYENDRLEEVR